MPTRLGNPFPPTWAGYPPSMAREDYAIWRTWYPALNPKPDALYFNVGVGAGREALDTATPAERAYWLHVTQKRIDALLLYPDHVRLVELRSRATVNALGRLLAYRRLLNDDNPFRVPIRTILVTDYPDPDLPELTRHARIEYIVWPPSA